MYPDVGRYLYSLGFLSGLRQVAAYQKFVTSIRIARYLEPNFATFIRTMQVPPRVFSGVLLRHVLVEHESK